MVQHNPESTKRDESRKETLDEIQTRDDGLEGYKWRRPVPYATPDS